MTTTSERGWSRAALNRTLARVVVGAGVGAGGAGVGFALADRARADFLSGPWSHGVALFLGLVLVLTGIVVIASAASRRTAALVAPGLEGMADPGTGRMTFVRLQGGVLALAGAAFVIPPVITALPGEVSPTLGVIAFAVIGGLIALQTLLNIRVWRRSDEMIRRVTVEAGAASFWIFQAGLFLWAAAEVLGLAPALTSWDLITLLMALYLAAATLIAARRGLT